jgi:hypothetical protein
MAMASRRNRNSRPAWSDLWFAGLTIALIIPVLGWAQQTSPGSSESDLLRRAGIAAQQFAQRMGMVRYTEHLSQRELRDDGKVNYQQDAFFDALTLIRRENGSFVAEESAERERPSSGFEIRPLLRTDGFTTMALILHPSYAQSFQFSILEDDMVSGRRLRLVHFEHIKGSDSPTALRLHGRDYPLAYSGTIWLDPNSAVVVRIIASLVEPVEEVGLRDLHCDVQYAAVVLPDAAEPFVLPVSATIDVQTPKQHWRNIHTYSNYRKYSVDVTVGAGEVK